MVVTVCCMKKSEKVQRNPLFKISGKIFGFGGDISFAKSDTKVRRYLRTFVDYEGTFIRNF